MKYLANSTLALNDLKGALVSNEHGKEFRIHDFKIALDNLNEVLVTLISCECYGSLKSLKYSEKEISVELSSMKNWTIQLQRGSYQYSLKETIYNSPKPIYDVEDDYNDYTSSLSDPDGGY